MSNNNRNGFVIGITGGIACGKSEVGRILENMGFAILDTDVLAHGLMRKGSPVHQEIVARFGEHILSDDGEIFRPVLGKIVFDDLEKRALLNRLVHPAVRSELDQWIGERRSGGQRAAGLVPLLFESAMQDLDWDATICVSSREPLVVQRLEERGLDSTEARQRINAQMPLADKEALADAVIRNNGTRRELELAVRETVEAMMG